MALIDVHLPGMSGLELARAAAASLPEVRVLIVSAYDDYAYVAEALEIGVGGYLLKTATARELVDAVRAVADGVFVLDQALSGRLTRRRRSGQPAAGALTRRESEVLGVLARGRSNQQIAAELGLGQRTVEGHVSSVLGKLGVASRAEAVAYALGHRLVAPEDHGDSSDAELSSPPSRAGPRTRRCARGASGSSRRWCCSSPASTCSSTCTSRSRPGRSPPVSPSLC